MKRFIQFVFERYGGFVLLLLCYMNYCVIRTAVFICSVGCYDLGRNCVFQLDH